VDTLRKYIPLLALFSAVAYGAIFICFGHLGRFISSLPLLTLMTLMSIPVLYVWAALKHKSFTIFPTTQQMLGPFFLSFLLFPGFMFLFSRAYQYTSALKLVLIYLSVFLLFEVWRLGKQKKLLFLLGASLFAFFILLILLSQCMTLWPILWAEGAMVLASVSLCLFRVLVRIWQVKTTLSVESASLFALIWSLPWLMAAMWISGEGLPLPPVSIYDMTLISIGAILFVAVVFVIEELRINAMSGGDYTLILFFFSPCFITVFDFLENGNWPDILDLVSFLGLMMGIIILSLPRSDKQTADLSQSQTEGVIDE